MGAEVVLRKRGAGNYIGVATIRADKEAVMQFHTGAQLEEVWLNGKRIYLNDWKHGYHIGRESVPGELKAGENKVVIRTGPVFFLSVTDGPMWDEPAK